MKKRLMGSTALSRKMFLRAPDDDMNIDGNNDDASGGGGGGTQKPNQTPKTPPKSDDDLGIGDIFTEEDGSSTDESEFSLPDEGDGEETDEEKAATQASQDTVRESLQTLMGNFTVSENDIPDELGFQDKAKAAEFMTAMNKRNLDVSLKMMLPVINHALTIATKQLDKRINSSVKQTSGQQEAAKAFNALGFTGSDAALAKTFYKTALGQKMTPQKAAIATRNAMKQLGKSGKPPSSGTSGGGNNPPSRIKEGAAALDSFFE